LERSTDAAAFGATLGHWVYGVEGVLGGREIEGRPYSTRSERRQGDTSNPANTREKRSNLIGKTSAKAGRARSERRATQVRPSIREPSRGWMLWSKIWAARERRSLRIVVGSRSSPVPHALDRGIFLQRGRLDRGRGGGMAHGHAGRLTADGVARRRHRRA